MARDDARVVVLATDIGVLGMGAGADPLDWDRDRPIHSSDPALPLNDRTSRFFTARAYKHSSRDHLSIVELTPVTEVAGYSVPTMWCDGHAITVRKFVGTTKLENFQVPSMWEVHVGDSLIGCITEDFASLAALAENVFRIAQEYIAARVREKNNAF